ncbi:MAG: dicarboxylate/amino acid:cation symporter [Finegoldia magna]|nr:dicarboxylate/amino acid:cation symporter [Finegoldia magna]
MKFVALAVTLVLFALLMFMAKKKMNFGTRTIVAAILGIIVGFIFKGNTEYVKVFGSIYANLLFAIVIPLLFTSIVSTVVSLESIEKMKKIGTKTIGILSLHNVLGSLIGLILGVAFKIGQGSSLTLAAEAKAKEVPTFAETFVNFFPDNVLGNAAEAKVVPIIVFSVLLGLAILQLEERGEGERAKPFLSFIDSAAAVIFRFTGMIIDFTPYAVLALMANAVSRTDMASMMPLIVVLILTYVASIFHSYITTGAFLAIFAKVNPFKFLKKFFPVLGFAFSTSSSNATVPMNINKLEELGVSRKISSFTIPLGATINMDGTAIMQGVAVVFAANAYGMQLTPQNFLTVIAAATLASVGTAGIPSVGLITLSMVFNSIGLPISAIAMIMGIDRILDMIRTAINITGDAVCTVIVANSSGEEYFDKEKFNS